jgi:16S rRNA (guanine527-N7)-methyltransferase
MAAKKKQRAGRSGREAAPDRAELARACEALGMTCDGGTLAGLQVYLGELMRWRRAVNLVGAADWRLALADLVADSWHLARLLQELDLPAEPVALDLGAGAGLPGLPLRLFWGAGEYWLVEVRERRCAFLRHALAKMGLASTHLFCGRAEDALARHAPVDLALSRAFLPWPEVLGLVREHLAPAGAAVIMANEPAPEPGQAPEGWRLALERAYPTGRQQDRQRYCWVFTPASA